MEWTPPCIYCLEFLDLGYIDWHGMTLATIITDDGGAFGFCGCGDTTIILLLNPGFFLLTRE